MAMTGLTNPAQADALEGRLDQVERELRERFAGSDRAGIRRSDPFPAYERYYRQFGQTYHVQHQVESVALKGKPIPRRAALVEAAFAEELSSGILTALHDGDAIGETIVADAAVGDEPVVLYNGKTVQLDAGDMYMRDENGVLTSVIRGPAAYGLITPETTTVVVCVYAPDGVGAEAVRTHLERIAANMRLISPNAERSLFEIVVASEKT